MTNHFLGRFPPPPLKSKNSKPPFWTFFKKNLTVPFFINFLQNLQSLTEFQVRYLATFLFFSVIDSFVWVWMRSLHKNIQLMLEFLKAPFLPTHLEFSNQKDNNQTCQTQYSLSIYKHFGIKIHHLTSYVSWWCHNL